MSERLTIQCKVCGFTGTGIQSDADVEDEEDLSELEQEAEECPRCGTLLTVLEADESARPTGVTTFEGGEATDGDI